MNPGVKNSKYAHRHYHDLSGLIFNKLTVLRLEEITADKRAKWRCVCACGKETVTYAASLKIGHVKSCGCLQKQSATLHWKSHGKSETEEYAIWLGMKRRCDSPYTPGYHNYGGRGIKVCDRWLGPDGFENFLADVGSRPSKKHSLDRFPDVNGDYTPENIRWATPKQQSSNLRRNLWVVYKGERMIYTEFWRRLGLKSNQPFNLIKKGWSPDQIEEHYKKKGKIK